LAAQDRVYPLNDAIEVMDNPMALDTKSSSLDDARETISKHLRLNTAIPLLSFIFLVFEVHAD
jgi:hypothetical protein